MSLTIHINLKKNLFFFLILLELLLWPVQALFCQVNEHTGLKYFRNYNFKTHDFSPQNWCVLQDKRGFIYVGNNGALLEFDGVSWREMRIPNRSVRSLTIDNTGTVYIGGINEIGFLAPGAYGRGQYISLVGRLAENQKNFSQVWGTHAADEGIYFRSLKFLFRWDSRQIKVWKAEAGNLFKASFTIEGTLFIRQENVGLLQMKNDALKLVPGGEAFASAKIYMMAPFQKEAGAQKLLIGTMSNGLYIYDSAQRAPFPTEVDDYLKEKLLIHGIQLSARPGIPARFALATLRGGLVIIDSLGRLKQIYNTDCGLLDDCVYHVFQDSHGNLWLAMNKGIAKIEVASPISVYDQRLNLPGIVLSVTNHQNDLYTGTTEGLYRLTSTSKFHPVPGVSGYCWHLLSIAGSLMAATTNGAFQFQFGNSKNILKQRIIENPAYFLLRSKTNQRRIWVGTREGLFSLYRENENNSWTKEHKLENINQEIRSIVEDKKGNLWLGTSTKQVLKVNFPVDGTIMNPGTTVVTYDAPYGQVYVFMAAGHVMFATEKGIFRFDEKSKVFVPDPTLGHEFANGSRGVFHIAEGKNNHIWFHSKLRNFHAVPQPNGTYILNKKSFLRIPPAQVNIIYPDPYRDITWFGSNDGLIRFDTRVNKNYALDFSTFIREVVINGTPLFFDAKAYKYKPGDGSKTLFPVFAHKNRNLRIEFAAPFFEDESSTRYQYLLEGYDEDWSAWTSETWKDYTNLDSGVQTFRVRAKNVYENVSREAVFQFKVLPPWYKTWWAFLIAALGFFLVVYGIVRWRSWKLEKEKQRLEQVIKERTKEINNKNKQLQDQSEKLKEMDKVKSRFFANISHEFRTPLTLIMGPLEQMLSRPRETEEKKKMKLMLRNSQRLLTLINQLLDLSKLDSGKMKLLAVRQNIISFLKGILASFEILADQNELELAFHAEQQDIPLYFDREKLEKVMYNLLANAVRYTLPGGKITIGANVKKRKEDFPFDFVEISVSDTGIGIPGDQLAHIFDRFYQADTSDPISRGHDLKGSGIGLALTKELVTLHRGEINVRSREGEKSGTEFIIRLPMGDAHLEPDQIKDLPGTPGERTFPETPAFQTVEKEEEEEPEAGMSETAKGEKNIILVVEDSADVRDYIRGALEPLYNVVEAKDGEEGINTAKEIIPDLIISDIMMPGTDGYELCRVLKNDISTSHIPIILLTAKAAEENIVEGLETGADDYITKPFNTKLLCARIKNLIDLRRQLQLHLNREMTLQPVKISVSTIDEEFIEDLQAVIEKNLGDPDFNVDLMCKRMYMSRATLYRKIQALSGESPTEFIRSYRLKRAAHLLKSGFGSVTEVAFEVGFSSRTYFTKCFKEKFHQLPSTYQASES